MSRPKLFPGGDAIVVIPPQSFASVDIEIEARTNGTFPVTLTVLTPTGDMLGAAGAAERQRQCTQGLGNLFTGAFLLVVLTWWVRHALRRTDAPRPVEGGHVASGLRRTTTEPADEQVDETALSPDAATSTLPPS